MAAPCGVPLLTWPYACPINDNNGLHFDDATGRLWVRPQVPAVTYQATPSFIESPGLVQEVNTLDANYLRIWWAAVYGDIGENVGFSLSTQVHIEHVNDTCLPQYARATVQVPAVRWFNTYQTTRALIIPRGRLNDANIIDPAGHQGTHDGTHAFGAIHPGEFGFPFGAGYPAVLGVESLISPGLDALPAGISNMRMPGHLADYWGGFQTVAPGGSVKFTYWLYAQTPDRADPYLLEGGLPDHPYLASYADVREHPGKLTVEVYA